MKHIIDNTKYSGIRSSYTWNNPLTGHTKTLSEEIEKKAKLDRERQNLALHMEIVAKAFGVSAQDLYAFLLHTVHTEEGRESLIAWRAARRLAE